MIFLVFVNIILLVYSEPRKPYWNDFYSGIINANDNGPFGEQTGFKSIGDLYYYGSKQMMRVTYWSWCLPYFNMTGGYDFTCTYVFRDDYVFYLPDESHGDCCYFEKFPIIPPDLWSRYTYSGVKSVHGKTCDYWTFQPEKNGTIFAYYSEVGNYTPIRFYGGNPVFGPGNLDFVFFNESFQFPDDLFDVPPECYRECSWPPPK